MKFVFWSIFLMLISCVEPEVNQNRKQAVTVLFHNYAPKAFISPGGMSHIPLFAVQYVDSMGHFHTYKPKEKDTLTIPTSGDFVELGLNYRHFEYIYYLLFRGDTVTVSVDSMNYPILASKHYPQHDRFYNLNYELRKGTTFQGMEAATCLGGGWYRIARERDFIKQQGWDNLLLDYCPLDSLQSMYLDYRRAYKDTLTHWLQNQFISEKAYRQHQFFLLIKKYRAAQMEKIIDRDTDYYKQMETGISDALLSYPSYQEYLHYYYLYFALHLQLLQAAHGTCPDWRQGFDELAIKELPLLSKHLLLRHCMNDIYHNFAKDDVTKYLERYMELTGDSALYKQITSEINATATSEHLILKDLQGDVCSLEDVLARNKGKVIYADFWASWCMPCKAEFSHAAKLREAYKNKDVVFLYLAYRDKLKNWQSACEEEDIDTLPTNYFIVNSENSKALEQIKLKYIPHYLIFDKNGMLKELNAPRPSSDLIQEMLDKYLAQ